LLSQTLSLGGAVVAEAFANMIKHPKTYIDEITIVIQKNFQVNMQKKTKKKIHIFCRDNINCKVKEVYPRGSWGKQGQPRVDHALDPLLDP